MATCLRSDLFPESFNALLAQTYEPLEIIVLADGANEETIQILKDCTDSRVRWFSTPKPSGMVPAWNLVCREAKGKYFLFCADDDVLLENAIDSQVEMMEEDEKIAFCHADFAMIDDDGKEVGRWISHEGKWVKRGPEEWSKYLVRTSCCMQTTVVRKSLWDQVGGWDEDAGNPGDNSLYLKLLGVGNVGHVAHVACKYRLRTKTPDAWSKKYANLREYYQLATKHLAAPPAGITQPLEVTRRKLMGRLSFMAVPLLLSAPDINAERELATWLQDHIWPGSPAGRCCQLLRRLKALRLVEDALNINLMARGLSKQLLRALPIFG